MRYVAAVTCIFVIGILLRLVFLAVPSYETEFDEGYYLRYAVYLAQGKNASIAGLFDDYIRNTGLHTFPNPLRVGYTIPAGWWLKLFNRFDFKTLACFSSFFSVCSLFMGYIFTLRLFDKRIALLSLILFISSPINLALSRRALQDSMVYFFTITTILLFYEAVNNRKLLSKILFMLSFFIVIAVKETSLLLLVFFAAYMLLEKNLFNKKLDMIPLLSAIFVALAGVLFLYINISGGADKIFQIFKIILSSPLSNEYAIKYQSGHLLQYLVDFLLLSPATLIISLSFMVLYVKNRDFRDKHILYTVTFFIAYYLAFNLFTKNVRYVMGLDLPIRVLTAISVYTACGGFKKRRVPAALLLVLIIALADILIFYHIFISRNVYDPVTNNLALAWKTWSSI